MAATIKDMQEIASGLKTNRTRLIGIIILELNNLFFAEVVAEMGDILRNHGYATMICDCCTDEKQGAETIRTISMPTGFLEGKSILELTIE